MKKLLIISILLAGSFALGGCNKISPEQPATQPVSQTPVVATPPPVTPVAVPAPASTSASAETKPELTIFGNAFSGLIVAIKKDTVNGVIPPTPDDHFIIASIDALTPEERLNLFKVIYVRAADAQSQTPTAVTPNTFEQAPLKATPGDAVLQGLTGG